MKVWQSMGFSSFVEARKVVVEHNKVFYSDGGLVVNEIHGVTYLTASDFKDIRLHQQEDAKTCFGMFSQVGDIYIIEDDIDIAVKLSCGKINKELLTSFIVLHEAGHLKFDYFNKSEEELLNSEVEECQLSNPKLSEMRADAYAIKTLGIDYDTYKTIRDLIAQACGVILSDGLEDITLAANYDYSLEDAYIMSKTL